MKYNFDKVIDRKITNSFKYDIGDDILPMWVADMDFDTPQFIKDEYIKRINQGAYGYTNLDEKFYNSYIFWWEKYHNIEIQKDWMMFSTGVIPSISAIIRVISNINDNIVILTPVYNIFYNCILNNHRKVLESKLIYNNNSYSINFNDLENKLKDKNTSVLLLCNPHNPIGKIWSKEELNHIVELCYKYNVKIISDEIHCDITYKQSYNPILLDNEEYYSNLIMLCSPTKTFNLAGIQTSLVVIPNIDLRKIIYRAINDAEVAEPNILAAITPSIVFSDLGREYLDQLLDYIYNNYKLIKEAFIDNELIQILNLEATYLLWINVEKLCMMKNIKNSAELQQILKKDYKLYINDGLEYGENGKYFIRVNLATQKENIIKFINIINIFIK